MELSNPGNASNWHSMHTCLVSQHQPCHTYWQQPSHIQTMSFLLFSIDIHFTHSSAIDGPSRAIMPGADIVWISHQTFSDATALLVDPQYALWAQEGVVANITTVDSTGIFARFLEHIMANTRDQELGLLHVDTELGDALLLCVLDEHQVISLESLRWHSSAEPTQKRL